MLARLILARDEQGRPLSDDCLKNQVGGFLFAGYEVKIHHNFFYIIFSPSRNRLKLVNIIDSHEITTNDSDE